MFSLFIFYYYIQQQLREVCKAVCALCVLCGGHQSSLPAAGHATWKRFFRLFVHPKYVLKAIKDWLNFFGLFYDKKMQELCKHQSLFSLILYHQMFGHMINIWGLVNGGKLWKINVEKIDYRRLQFIIDVKEISLKYFFHTRYFTPHYTDMIGNYLHDSSPKKKNSSE